MPANSLTAVPKEGPRRTRPVIPGIPVLRDQELLHEKCIQFELGYAMADFLIDLHNRVFFWSGWPDRPIRPGRNAIKSYSESDFLLRIPFLDVVEGNTPYFSRCNSGATRMQHGKPVPRGSKTFLLASDCDFPPSQVVEVTFLQAVKLPSTTEMASSLEGPWDFFVLSK
jgi:hypothetical protein